MPVCLGSIMIDAQLDKLTFDLIDASRCLLACWPVRKGIVPKSTKLSAIQSAEQLYAILREA